MMDYDKATTLAKNLRKFALFVQDNASELPDDIAIEVSTHLWSWDTTTDTEVPVAVGKAMKAAVNDGADIEKKYTNEYFRCYMTWGYEEPKIVWKIATHREDVCERKVVGTHMVKKMVAPEGDWTEKEVEEEIVEWECHSLLKMAGDND